MSAKKSPSLGNMIDSLYETRAQRLELSRKADELKTVEAGIKKQIMEMLESQGLESSSGKLATASLTSSTVPRVSDWPKFGAYVLKNKALEMLHQRISTEAWREAIAAGKKVPGVEAVDISDLSLTKSQRS